MRTQVRYCWTAAARSPRSRVQAHQGPVGGFVERIELQPPAGVAEGVVDETTLRQLGDQARGRGAEGPPQALPLAQLPLVERRAVPQGEARQQVAAPQRRRGRHVADVVGGEPRGEGAHVDGDAIAVEQGQLVAARVDRRGAESVLHDRQGPPQRRPSPGLVGLGPEQGGQGLPPLPVAR